MSKRKDITGRKYGRLTAVRFVGTREITNKVSVWLFKCECGEEKLIQVNRVGNGINSCGCLKRDTSREMVRTHGMTGTPVYVSWKSMRNRCLNKNASEYGRYGGRGIKICREWNKFTNFYRDMGAPPIGATLDRIDVNGDYCKKNCRWATRKVQNYNKRTTIRVRFEGQILNLDELSSCVGIPASTLRQRYKHGFRGEKLVSPVKTNKK